MISALSSLLALAGPQRGRAEEGVGHSGCAGELIDSPGLSFPGLASAQRINIGAHSSGLLWRMLCR